MPWNVPSYDTDNISFGPGVLYLGPAGTTPTTDLGAITEDGITLVPTREHREIVQGNPKIPILSFDQSHGFMVRATGIEWDVDKIAKGFGAGQTTLSGSADTWAFGGNPIPHQVAIQIDHAMPQTGNTMTAYIWKAVAEGGTELPLTHDEHQFGYSWMALRATTDWAGNALGQNEQLAKIIITYAT